MKTTAAFVGATKITVASILDPGGVSPEWEKEDLYYVALHTVMAMGVRLKSAGALLVSRDRETMEKIRLAIFPPGKHLYLLIPEYEVWVEKSGVMKMEMLINHHLGIAFDNRFVRKESDYVTSFGISMVNDERAELLISNLETMVYC